VIAIGESVDDGQRAGLGEVDDVALGEGADHHGIQVSGEDASGVGDRLASPQLDVRRRQE
jgi:hypothetical protein